MFILLKTGRVIETDNIVSDKNCLRVKIKDTTKLSITFERIRYTNIESITINKPEIKP